MIQVMLNLLSNAVKFCDSANGWIAVALLKRDGGLRVDVRDNGRASRPEDHEAVFTKFSSGGRYADRQTARQRPRVHINVRSSSISAPDVGGKHPRKRRALFIHSADRGRDMSRKILIADDEPSIVCRGRVPPAAQRIRSARRARWRRGRSNSSRRPIPTSCCST